MYVVRKYPGWYLMRDKGQKREIVIHYRKVAEIEKEAKQSYAQLREFLTEFQTAIMREEYFKVLTVLYAAPDWVYTRQICKITGLSRKKVSKILDYFKAKGIVERKAGAIAVPNRNRMFYLDCIFNRLTEKGKKLVELILEINRMLHEEGEGHEHHEVTGEAK